tara:strand:+ start:83 stop:406 length:324 start_codon:yes stop_codon:yes gene_type:complete
MHKPKFQYGPIAKGVFGGLVPLSILVALFATDMIGYYLVFLAFLALGLKPILEKSGLYDVYVHCRETLSDKYHRRRHDEIGKEVDRKARDEKYRRSRVRDPKLPKNW